MYADLEKKRKRDREYMRKYTRMRKLKGLCPICGKHPDKGVLCKACKTRQRTYYDKDVVSQVARTKKIAVLTHYSHGLCKCVCCGESRIPFLSIDHIHGNGTRHRKEIKGYGKNMYAWLIKNQFPKGFQTLCLNCNLGRQINGGMCPHEEERMKAVA